MTYVLITAARDEEKHIIKTLDSVIAQTQLPERWVIVDDGSTDRTAEIVQGYANRFHWIELVRAPARPGRSFAGKAQGVNVGLERVRSIQFEVTGNLDADVSFEPDYMEFLMQKFSSDPDLGVAGTPLIEDDGYDSAKDSFEGENHVAGPCQLFRYQCFQDIGGYVPNREGGIDWIAVMTARMKGWQTKSFPEKRLRHHRRLGTAGKSIFAGSFSDGKKDYYLGGSFVWQLFRVAYQVTKPPLLIYGLGLLLGYCSAAVRRVERPISKELIRFHRREQMKKLRVILGSLIRMKKVDSFSLASRSESRDQRSDVRGQTTEDRRQRTAVRSADGRIRRGEDQKSEVRGQESEVSLPRRSLGEGEFSVLGHPAAATPASLPRYVLITPARNEEAFITKTLDSMVAQTWLPERWVIVDDGSTDRTAEIVESYGKRYAWIELIRRPLRQERHFAGKAHAFNAGFERVRSLTFDVIGNIDADISFDSDHMELLLRKFVDDPRLGVAGTPMREVNYNAVKDSFYYNRDVFGACQLFRRQCFEQVGGYTPIKWGGLDWVAVRTARMKGWDTRSFNDRLFYHHRPMGATESNVLKAKFDYGRKDYFLGNHPLWQVFRVGFQLMKPPYIVGGLLVLSGYLHSVITRVKRPVSGELLRFHRREQLRRLKNLVLRRADVSTASLQ